MNEELKTELGINEWLELIKEDKNLNGAYISIYQYIYLVEKENQKLKKHLKVPKACNLKTLEDYKSYYEDTTREQILEDTYIEYCAYVNLAHRYSKLAKQQKEFIKWLEKKQSFLRDEISELTLGMCNTDFQDMKIEVYEKVLQKYKEIIGDD